MFRYHVLNTNNFYSIQERLVFENDYICKFLLISEQGKTNQNSVESISSVPADNTYKQWCQCWRLYYTTTLNKKYL